MRERVLTAVIGLPVLILLVNIGGLPLNLVFCALSLAGLAEFYHAFFSQFKPIQLLGYAFTVFYYLSIHFLGTGWLLAVFTLFIIALQTGLVLFYRQVTIKECVTTLCGFFYVPFLLSFIVLTRNYEQGRYFVWLIFTSAFGCDTFAYITGMTIGRHKLTDTPSPRKSIEGVIGGVAGAALVGAVYGYFVSHYFNANVQGMTLNSTIVSLFGGIFSVIGDLSASAVKRYTKIKDFGSLFPGHGGVLDRFDSVIMTAPIVYMVMTAVIFIRGLAS